MSDLGRMAKIQALLAKAESSTFPEEAKVFTAKAYELMEKWAIDEAMMRGMRPESIEVGTVKFDLAYSPYLAPKRQLLHVLALHFDCRAVFTSYTNRYTSDKSKRNVSYVTLVGMEKDLQFVRMLFTSLLLQADIEFLTDAVQSACRTETSHPGHRIKWRNTWMLGYINGIMVKLAERKRFARAEAENATPGVGLVLASKKDRVDKAFNDQVGRTKTMRSNASFAGGSAYGSGRDAGGRADVGDPRVGGTKGALR